MYPSVLGRANFSAEWNIPNNEYLIVLDLIYTFNKIIRITVTPPWWVAYFPGVANIAGCRNTTQIITNGRSSSPRRKNTNELQDESVTFEDGRRSRSRARKVDRMRETLPLS